MNDNFLKSDHPAVARTKPRLSSPFPIANPAFGSPSPISFSLPPDPYNQSSSPRELRQEADTQEVINSFNEYIIPIPDPKPEDAFTDVPSGSPARYRASNADTADGFQMRVGLREKQATVTDVDQLNYMVSKQASKEVKWQMFGHVQVRYRWPIKRIHWSSFWH